MPDHDTCGSLFWHGCSLPYLLPLWVPCIPVFQVQRTVSGIGKDTLKVTLPNTDAMPAVEGNDTCQKPISGTDQMLANDYATAGPAQLSILSRTGLYCSRLRECIPLSVTLLNVCQAVPLVRQGRKGLGQNLHRRCHQTELPFLRALDASLSTNNVPGINPPLQIPAPEIS